jgi:hypothetical protein
MTPFARGKIAAIFFKTVAAPPAAPARAHCLIAMQA